MRGRVTSRREAVIELQVKGPRGRAQRVMAVIDTGFTEWLALPRERIAGLGLTVRGAQSIVLADGTEMTFPVYWATVRWHGARLPVPVLAIGSGALIGMGLLEGSRMTLDVAEDGPVRIEPMGEP